MHVRVPGLQPLGGRWELFHIIFLVQTRVQRASSCKLVLFFSPMCACVLGYAVYCEASVMAVKGFVRARR
jgi:hypothetical protein